MIRLTISEIINKIEKGECFHAVASDYSLTIKIDNYVPYICAAIHNGNQFRMDLHDKCLHTEYERWFEEDPATLTMVEHQPIVVSGCDSRFEYDLNRAPEVAIYTDAWGKKLWKEELSISEKSKSIEKHANFYKVVHALVSKIESLFAECFVYDMHSYNWKRWDREVPTWNLGTKNIDSVRFGNAINDWRNSLSEMELPNDILSTAAINDTFQGNGYFLKYITSNFKNTLVLATEVKKVYCDELNQIVFPEVVFAISQELNQRIKKHANNYLS